MADLAVKYKKENRKDSKIPQRTL